MDGILSRDRSLSNVELLQAALMWSKKYCDSNQNQDLKEVIGNFLEYIQFHKIPANVLMREVHPLGLVPSSIIVNALAYQVRVTSETTTRYNVLTLLSLSSVSSSLSI